MLTRVEIRNFKKFEHIDVELGDAVVLIGPNNSGKTSALQALTLWHYGLKKYLEKRGLGEIPKSRPGVTINRKDLYALPVGLAAHLWKDAKFQRGQGIEGKTITSKIPIQIIAEGITNGTPWRCGFEFDYQNEESILCRPITDEATGERMAVPESVRDINISFLPPMSGLTASEDKLEKGSIDIRIGQGRTAEVLRNLCFQVLEKNSDSWADIVRAIKDLFGIVLNEPRFLAENGTIDITYHEAESDLVLNISSSGRGLQQTLLLLAWLHLNPNAVLLVDEPDAHLEILRQRQVYNLLTGYAQKNAGQIVAASHSEILLNEAGERDLVIAFVGRTPHRINDKGTQLLKALREIGWESYYQAEQKGWILYLEGSTDLEILKALAVTLDHPARSILNGTPFVHYVANQASKALGHYYGLREAKPDLAGLVILDNQPDPPETTTAIAVKTWERREIENYLFSPETLLSFAESQADGSLFAHSNREAMQQALADEIPPAALRDRTHDYWITTKASEALIQIFKNYYKRLGLYNLMDKSNFHRLAIYTPKEIIPSEINTVLDMIYATAQQAKPRL